MKLFVILVAFAAIVASALPIGNSNWTLSTNNSNWSFPTENSTSTVPHEIKMQARATGCTPTSLEWVARKSTEKEGMWENQFRLDVREKYSRTLGYRWNSGLEVRRSDDGLWSFTHRDIDNPDMNVVLMWKGQPFYHAAPNWVIYRPGTGSGPGTPDLPPIREYWYCLPGSKWVME
ncbi:hypothetical protein BGX23_002824 [Mortierella sp. AD031]|nr:hypothetical protein BGX23_002824 [Mortierella sp. AD031]KAG0201480.1 hypothetical protein BGX33_010283 [Mortierella sp. NVP41]